MGNEREGEADPTQTQEGTTLPPHPELIQRLARQDGMEPGQWVKARVRLALAGKAALVSPADQFAVLHFQGAGGEINAAVVCTYSAKEDGEAHVALAREKRQGGVWCLYHRDGQPCNV